MSDAKNVAKEETTRQAIILVFSLATAVGTLVIMKGVTDWRTVKMGTALIIKRICQHEADAWQKWADDAASFYNREKE